MADEAAGAGMCAGEGGGGGGLAQPGVEVRRLRQAGRADGLIGGGGVTVGWLVVYGAGSAVLC